MTEKHDAPGEGADTTETPSPWSGDDKATEVVQAPPPRPGSRWLPDAVGAAMPNTGNRALIFWLVAAAVLAWPAFTSVHQIAENEQGVVSRLGQIDRIVGPGVAATWPAPFETVDRVNVAEGAIIDFAEKDGGQGLLTADGNIVDVAWSVRWHVADTKIFLTAMDDGTAYLRSLAAAAMTQAIGSLTLQEGVTPQRGRLAARVHAIMQTELAARKTGIALDGVQIADVRPPNALAEDMRRVETARANAAKAVTDAQAAATQLRRRAQEEAADFDRIYAQYVESPDVTRTRLYYETMEYVLRRAEITVAPNGSAERTPAPPPAETAAEEGAQ